LKRRGLIRLWIVATAIFVPGLAYWAVNDNMKTWAQMDAISIRLCVDQEGRSNFDVDKCVHDAGADQTMFQHEQTTPGRYWAEALTFSFIIDVVLTALLVGAFLIGRWVVRGFRTEV